MGRRRGSELGGWIVTLGSFFGLTLLWMWSDYHLPDGDELGHLGAFHLYADVVQQRGLRAALWESFSGTGDYPPLFALALAIPLAFFRGLGPEMRILEALLAAYATLQVAAVAGLTRACLSAFSAETASSPARRDWSPHLAAFAWMTFPLPAALSRHAMPEPFLALVVTLALWAGVASRGFTRVLPTVAGGLLLAAAGLTKQTSVLYLLGPLGLLVAQALLVGPGRARSLLGLMGTVFLAAPLPLAWLLMHRREQTDYAARSVSARSGSSWLDALLYYPLDVIGQGVGLLWTLPLLWALVRLARGRARTIVGMTLIGLVVLTFVPRKYPRLLVPALPMAAVAIGIGLCQRRREEGTAAGPPAPASPEPPQSLPSTPRRLQGSSVLGLGLVGLQQLALSGPALPDLPEPWLGVWRPALFDQLDPGCPQIWIRPLEPFDAGLHAMLQQYRMLEKPAGGRSAGEGVIFLEELEVPCPYETTFPMSMQLVEYARMRGEELGDVLVGAQDPAGFVRRVRTARLVISPQPWCEPLTIERLGQEPLCAERGHFEPTLELWMPFGEPRARLHLYARTERGDVGGH